ncbi:MAG TPA: T9SS type A sorting domain-containing protein [Saprospiraceae bacterium]|nr:T9SS type A sorting domain-containing protein [Saprospiraceae bacterium]
MKKLLIIFFVFVSNFLPAQNFKRIDIPFAENGKQLEYPLTGGLNAPQISGVDLNHDGLTDLLVNDRIGGVALAFLYDQSTESKYKFAPGLTKYFPPTENWALMKDFNGDNVPDLFTYSIAPGIDGITPYRGKWVNDTLQFTMITSTGGPSPLILPYSVPNGSKGNLYVTTIDIPTFADMDNDGDLDIMSFDTGGGFINYYKNNSVEKGFGKDSLIYSLHDQCWGKVFEGLSSTISLSSDANKCSQGLLGGGVLTRHVGSTLLAVDLDGDGDKDMLVGDVSYGNITALFNTGTPQNAWVTAKDTLFPHYNIPVMFPDFPASYTADVFNDGNVDLVFATNSTGITEDRNVFQVYHPQQPGFSNMKKSDKPLLTDQMIDLGTGTHPAFIDIDNDGDMDMIAGTFNSFTNLTERNGHLYLYENTGTADQAVFELVDSDFLGFSAFSNLDWGFAPTVGDLDGDGDVDILTGSEDGILYYNENTAGVGNVPVFAATVVKYKDIDVGQAASPFIFDVDDDGLPDLLIGERNGNINFLPNQGSLLNPQFEANVDKAPNINYFGKVDTRQPGYASGYSSPVLFRINDKLHLLTGSLSGGIQLYNDIENNFTGKFTAVTKQLGNINEGERTKPVLTKLIKGDYYNMVVGNMRGGFGVFGTNISTKTTAVKNLLTQASIRLMPNPVEAYINIMSPDITDLRSFDASIFDMQGRQWYSMSIIPNIQQIDVSALPSGMYFIHLRSLTDSRVLKFVKN